MKRLDEKLRIAKIILEKLEEGPKRSRSLAICLLRLLRSPGVYAWGAAGALSWIPTPLGVPLKGLVRCCSIFRRPRRKRLGYRKRRER